MIEHYLKIAIRTLLRNKVYAFINVLGLAMGIGACLLIYQYIDFELSYDRFHPNSENAFRLKLDHFKNNSLVNSEVLTPHGLGKSAKQSIPEIQNMVRIRPMREDEGVVVSNLKNDRKFLEYSLYYVDNAFLEVFDFPLKFGDGTQALNDPNSIVLTDQTSKKYFGDANPIGEVLQINGGSLSGEFIVTGVLNPLPQNTHLDFDFLLPLEFMLTHYGIYTRYNGWKWYNFYTYIILNPGSNLQHVESKFDQVIQSNIGEGPESEGIDIKTDLQNIESIHLKSNFARDLAKDPGSIENVFFFGVIGVIILTIAYLNFINLSTSQATQRNKEVGVRKSLGVQKFQLIAQFLSESVIINILAALFGVLLAYFLIPVLSHFIDKEIEFTIIRSTEFLMVFFLIILLGSFLSGIYPAIVLSSFNPIKIFGSDYLGIGSSIRIRKMLIGLQFAISIVLISGSYIVYKQIHFMKNKDLGIDMEKIIVVPGARVVLEESRDNLSSKYHTFKSEIKNHPSISSITGTSNIPGRGVKWYGDMKKLGAPIDAFKEGKVVLVDANFTDTYDFEFLAGSGFTPDMKAYSAVIINEESLAAFQLGDPQEAIGQSIIIRNIDTLSIQGVVKNAHWSSLRDMLSPTIFAIDQYNAYFSLRTNLSNVSATLDYVQAKFKESFPNDPFDYFFLDESFNGQYKADLQFGNLFTAFTLLAIFLSCIGLLAFVSFSASLRTREISIRKVLGATPKNIIALLSKEYFILMTVAGIVGIPFVIIWARYWLEGFAYRINLGVDMFLLPALLLLLISSITVGYKTYIAAIVNPVDSLQK